MVQTLSVIVKSTVLGEKAEFSPYLDTITSHLALSGRDGPLGRLQELAVSFPASSGSQFYMH